jgi:hypothetical protein
MREAEEKRDRAQNRPVSVDESSTVRDEVDSCVPHDPGIPDYVMRDFSPPEEDEKEEHANGTRT